ncbi:rab11 family-interacting protein 1 isoform X1 [Embiotoca jacksoni]|uniref:rab11 family-interacting protein 1 isoform X1 n=1 Tax=Embiotoca jacksoni TaxID=100190 RepID=UPI003704480A
MSSLTVEEDQKWLPTHVQVTVLRGRGLRGKGKHGTSDVYTIIQLGKEKYSTCVAEKTTEPEWREECSFEVHPGVLESGGRSGYPAGANELVLTTMHRALIGLDVFLGQAVIQLDKVFHETRCVKNMWYRLNSKTGKKEKERGEIQVTVQFTRNNLTASMYDLVMKDKSASTFTKLKERIKGKRRSSEDDSSSAVLPSGYGSLYRMRQRLPSDGGGEEDYEDDEGGEARRSKMRTFFLRGKLRKSSDTRSSTSLGSESSESSSRGGSLSPTAGISVVVSDLSNSPSNSSNLTADNSPEHTANTSPKSSSLTCEFGDEAGEITIAVPQPTVCVNGSHSYQVQPPDPGSGTPAGSLGLGLLQKSLPLSVSLQNLRPDADLPRGLVGDGRRWSFDKPGEEEKAAIAAALEKSGPMLSGEEEQLGRAAPPQAASLSSASAAESDIQGKKPRRNLLSHERNESAGKGQSRSKDESEQTAASEEKYKGWFGSKESHSKPSLVVSPKLEPSTDPHPPPLPPTRHPSGPPVDPSSLGSPLHHTNPFCPSQSTPPPISPCNPFFSVLQHNPFYEDTLTPQHLKPSLPPLPYLSSSRPPIAQLFPQPGNPNPTNDNLTTEDLKAKLGKRPLPPTPTDGKKPLLKKLSNPFMSVREPDSEWDESFEAFAAGRLQSPEDLATDCKTLQNPPSDHQLEHGNNKGALLPVTEADQSTNARSCTDFLFEAHKVTGQGTNTNLHHLDTFSKFLETIPEHTPSNSACTDTKQDTSANNDLTDTNMHQTLRYISSTHLNSGSPDPSSSGLGSLAEDDFLSCISSHSDKFSASSSEEAESNILGFENSSDSSVVKTEKPSESDMSDDLSLIDASQRTVIQHGVSDSEKELIGSLAQRSPVLTHPQPVIPTDKTGTEGINTQTLNISDVVYPDFLPNFFELQPKLTFNESREESVDRLLDFSKDFTNTSTKNDPDVQIPASADAERSSTPLSLNITTSSPGAEQHLSDTFFGSAGLGEQDANVFGDFHNISHIGSSPSRDFDDTLLCLDTSDRSSSSFLQSLYVSPDSQDYQTCESHQSSKCWSVSEPNETLYSANSTLCGEIKTTTGATVGLVDSPNASRTSNGQESLRRAQDKPVTLELSFPTGDGSQVFPAAATDSHTSCNPKRLNEGGVKTQQVVSADGLAECPQVQTATLHRSQSEGALAPAFDELLLPSFGSDPGVMLESSLAQPGPHFPTLISFAPSLSPDRSSSPVALYILPSLANASASLPTGAAPVPMLQETEQQQQQQQQQAAANLQNSPHPVKPLTTAMLAEEKRSVLATGLEKFKSTIHPGRSSQLTEQETDRKKVQNQNNTANDSHYSATEGAGSYYHLTHSELVALLVHREAELNRQKAEFERQKLLLSKRELELRRLKPQVKDLEDYIDTLLVRIMEQKPTLLQVRSKFK